MARLFALASTEYLLLNNPPATVEPITMACWFNSTTIAASQYAMSLADKDVTDHYMGMQVAGGAGGDPIRAVSVGGGGAVAETSSGYSVNTWHHGCCVWAADDDRRAYIDGGSKGTNATNIATANIDSITIARAADLTPAGSYFDGMIAEAAIWSAALTDNEVFQLAQGVPAVFIRPQSLAAYWPLFETDRDFWRSIYNMTAFNTPAWREHPPKVLEQWRRYQSR